MYQLTVTVTLRYCEHKWLHTPCNRERLKLRWGLLPQNIWDVIHEWHLCIIFNQVWYRLSVSCWLWGRLPDSRRSESAWTNILSFHCSEPPPRPCGLLSFKKFRWSSTRKSEESNSWLPSSCLLSATLINWNICRRWGKPSRPFSSTKSVFIILLLNIVCSFIRNACS